MTSKEQVDKIELKLVEEDKSGLLLEQDQLIN